MRFLNYIFLSFIIFLSCRKDKPITVKVFKPYSFFVAGHTYGSPTNYLGGLYTPFVSKFNTLSKDSTLKFGFLTGDIVKYSTPFYWDLVDADVNLLNKPVYFALGNHGATNKALFETRYGKSYYSIEKNNDLFIVLDGNIDQWKISGKQLDFLDNEIKKSEKKTSNIFIFCHQIIFADKYGVASNSFDNKADTLNFETTVLPILEKTGKKVYIFCGDIGAFENGQYIFYERDKNVTYIASGMGGGLKDNFIIVNVDKNKSISFKLVALNGSNEMALGKLEDY